MDIEGLQEAIERLKRGQADADDLQTLWVARRVGRIAISVGERSVAITGSADGAKIYTGDITYNLSVEALSLLLAEKYEPPAPPPIGELAEVKDFLPPGSWVTHMRNEVFTGRESDLLMLAEALLYDPNGEGGLGIDGRKVVAHGMGGIGKSQLAVEFCYRYGRFFHGVHWLQGEQKGAGGNLETEIVVCGEKMGIQPWPEKVPEKVTATLQAWERSMQQGERRLVVLDNVEQLEVLRKWLPELMGLRVLVTSRRGKWPRSMGLQVHHLGIFERGESRDLLRRLSSRLSEESDVDLDGIADRLGDLPLAIHLAGLYIEERTALSPAEYLKELSRAEGMLTHHSLLDWTEDSPTRHDTNLITTFLLSWMRLTADRPDNKLAREVFLGACYCAPNRPIPAFLLQTAFGKEERYDDVDLGLRRLYELGLLNQERLGPSIHPLLAEYGRYLNKDEKTKTQLKQIVEALEDISDHLEERGHPLAFSQLEAHLEAAVKELEKVDREGAARLWNNLGYFDRMVGLYGQAKEHIEQALEICRDTHWENQVDTLQSLNNMGMLLKDMGDLAGARFYLEQAIDLPQSKSGKLHAISLNNMGLLMQDMGNLSGAKSYYEKSLAIYQNMLDMRNREAAQCLNNMGFLLQEMGDLSGASQYYELGLVIRKEVLGERHQDTAQSLNNIGYLLLEMGDLTRANIYLRQALEIRRDVLGERHTETALSLNNMGYLLEQIGDLAGAMRYYEEALEIRRDTLGVRHPDTATSLNNLGVLLCYMGNLVGARSYLEQALEIRRDVLSERHPDTANSLSNLGMLLKAMGDLEDAKSYLEQALEILETMLPRGHPDIEIVRENLQALLAELRKGGQK